MGRGWMRCTGVRWERPKPLLMGLEGKGPLCGWLLRKTLPLQDLIYAARIYTKESSGLMLI